MEEQLKQAVADLRAAETNDAAAGAAKTAAERAITEAKAAVDRAVKEDAAAASRKSETAKSLAEAKAALASRLKPGVLWTESGTTAFLVDQTGKLHELKLNYIDKGAPQ